MAVPQICPGVTGPFVSLLNASTAFPSHSLPFLFPLVGYWHGWPSLACWGCWGRDLGTKSQLQRHFSRVTEDRWPVPTVGSKNNWLTKNNESELEMMKLFCILGSVTCAFMLGKVHQNVTSKQAHFTAWKSYLNRANFKKEAWGLQTWLDSEI